jgi:hypothetical protein
VQNRVEQRLVNPNAAVVIDVAELPEAIHEKLTRDRVVPIISARVVCVTGGIFASGAPGSPYSAINKSVRANRLSLELNS